MLGKYGRVHRRTELLQTAAQHLNTPSILKALRDSAAQGDQCDIAKAAHQELVKRYEAQEDYDALAKLEKSRLPTLNAQARKPRVAGIMDEFTTACYKPECIFLALLPNLAKTQLENFAPDFVFIESAWHGNEGVWNQKVSNVSEELRTVLDWCRETQTPSIFWNKEDPVHFTGFLETARLCDYVFTTDIDCIPAYKQALGHDRVFVLPFAAQPVSHNPIATFQRKDAFNFAGSYYLRYPERQRDIATLIDTVREFRPVDIYDRNHGGTHPHYMFPPEYRPMILGRLPFSEIDRAYKEYRYGINMNTIKQSQTMFARRVFELMASNTVVVSNFSRGVRTLFGDLALCSDNPGQLRKRLDVLTADDTVYRKFRLAGLRKVMQQHTYRARMDFILSCISGDATVQTEPHIALFATITARRDIKNTIKSFQAQSHKAAHLYLLTSGIDTDGIEVPNVTLSGHPDILIAQALEARSGTTLFGAWHPRDHYGPNYLTDLELAMTYSDAEGFGKACHYLQAEGETILVNEAKRYRPAQGIPLRASLLKSAHMTRDLIAEIFDTSGECGAPDVPMLALDEFNYCKQGATVEAAIAWAADLDIPFQGIEIESLYEAASVLPAGETRRKPRATPFPTLTAAEVHKGSVISKSSPMTKTLEGDLVRFAFTADPNNGPHYVWIKNKYTRETLNLVDQSVINFEMEHTTADARLVVEFYDAADKKISHSMLAHGGSSTLAIPTECTRLRFGLRLTGDGEATLSEISFGTDATLPLVIVGPSDTLVLTKQYPSYDDLYKYGFLHSRVRGYRQQSVGVDVFRINPNIVKTYDEFENIDIASGDAQLLDATLATGRYKHVLVHLIDRQMWEVLQKHLDHVKVTVWIHGAEIQGWQRRAYEFATLTAPEIERKKKLANERLKLWQKIFAHPSANLHLVFVSETLRTEANADVGTAPRQGRWSVIHNHIDTDLFSYRPKTAAQAGQVLSIRPYSSTTYANDLSVQAILELSRRPVFKDLSFRLVGDGPLFESVTEPLRDMPNVTLQQTFLSHADIATLHAQYGIFLNPTRMDSQGVSRDEAMASGLVPVTSSVAAVPEFVDDTCGILAPAEDYFGLADAIERLYGDPALFTELSKAASARVRAQSGFEQTIARELELIARA
ncbi:glycosyltransferase family protein [Sulfitobacter donghicola]|uniref:glycosyltransferase family protein n=1 Tax=Sulfitobacter donghicola TaxID=421000 RepID=UPI0012DBFA62|nr:glycosyltransferase [Sulfitobacter donghicola]